MVLLKKRLLLVLIEIDLILNLNLAKSEAPDSRNWAFSKIKFGTGINPIKMIEHKFLSFLIG